MARQKLKLAEQLSDISTCTDEEREEIHKKSRKFRAAKAHESSSYDYDFENDDETDSSNEKMFLSCPKPPTNKLTEKIPTKRKTFPAYKGKQ